MCVLNVARYKQDGMIRKEAFLNENCLTELRRIIESSEIMREDDNVRRPERCIIKPKIGS